MNVKFVFETNASKVLKYKEKTLNPVRALYLLVEDSEKFFFSHTNILHSTTTINKENANITILRNDLTNSYKFQGSWERRELDIFRADIKIEEQHSNPA